MLLVEKTTDLHTRIFDRDFLIPRKGKFPIWGYPIAIFVMPILIALYLLVWISSCIICIASLLLDVIFYVIFIMTVQGFCKVFGYDAPTCVQNYQKKAEDWANS